MSEIVSRLKEFAKLNNLADEANLTSTKKSHDEVIDAIGQRVLNGYNIDHKSMEEWLADVKKVEELASMVAKKKNKPLPNSANIKYPLITKAGYEFSSRTYPEIIRDGKVVKGRVIGIDLDDINQEKCDRVSDYMNYQLLFEQEEWELELDRLLNRISLIGFVCKKSYYDPIRNMIKSVICEHEDLIINCDVKSLQEARRITHVIHFRLNDLIEHVNSGIFCNSPILELKEELGENEKDEVIDILEQHTFLDLDEDGYTEPYIVSVLKKNGKVLRIAPRFRADDIVTKDKGELKYIDALQYFTDYHFLVSPKGKFQSVGFGILMLHLNETINTVLNQLIDAGQLANLKGGYKDARLKNMGSGDSLHVPGEFKTLKATAGATIKDGIVPIQYGEPSSVLFKLLGLLIETGKDLSSSSEVMTGSSSADNAKTGAVQALQQEGLKVFTGIQRRVHRSLTSEFKKLYVLNSIYADPKKYFTVLNQHKFVMKDDFDLKHVHVLPVADPNLSSDVQRAQKNQMLIAAQQLPGTNKNEITKLILQNSNLGVPVEQLLDTNPPPNPEMIKIQAEIQSWAEDKKLKGHELDIRMFEAKTEYFKVEAQILELKAKAMLEMAQAQAQQDNGKFKEYEIQLSILSEHLDAMRDAAKFMQDGQMHNNEMAQNQQQLDQQQQSIDNEKQANQQQGDQGVAG